MLISSITLPTQVIIRTINTPIPLTCNICSLTRITFIPSVRNTFILPNRLPFVFTNCTHGLIPPVTSAQWAHYCLIAAFFMFSPVFHAVCMHIMPAAFAAPGYFVTFAQFHLTDGTVAFIFDVYAFFSPIFRVCFGLGA